MKTKSIDLDNSRIDITYELKRTGISHAFGTSSVEMLDILDFKYIMIDVFLSIEIDATGLLNDSQREIVKKQVDAWMEKADERGWL